ncbi:MAG: iron uptake porin [Nodosilinea sp.]
MSKLLWLTWLAPFAPLGAVCAVSSVAVAAPIDIDTAGRAATTVPLAPSTSISELSDVLPSDWAFQALQHLVETYGCLQGYPDETFRGQRPLTRFEFAAGLNACLDVVAGLASQGNVAPGDLATLTRLQAEFQAELVVLGTGIATLEAETADLQAQQFSTTTKLEGQADFNLGIPLNSTEVFDDDNTPEVVENRVSVAARARLNFDASFTGDDRLRLRLQGRSGEFLQPFGGLADGGDGDYEVDLTDFYYTFPLGERVDITVSARGLQGSDWVTSTILPYDGPAVASASAPGFYDAGGSSGNGSGLGISLELTDDLVLDAGYTASNSGGATDPAIGLFAAASQSYIAQLSYLGDGVLNAGLVYMHSDQSAEFADGEEGAANTYAGLVSFDFGNFFVAGHGAYQAFNGGTDVSWTVGLGVKDFLLEGSQLGLYGGQLPQLEDYANNAFLVEGYFEIPVNQFLTITPAVVYGEANLRNDGGTRTDDTSLYGVLRATFKF